VQFPGATHLVICCRGKADEALATMRLMMSRLKLTVNETKTRVCKLPEEKFDFFGYTFGRCYSQADSVAAFGVVNSLLKITSPADHNVTFRLLSMNRKLFTGLLR
jgi:RNA-directed DNA polymerase